MTDNNLSDAKDFVNCYGLTIRKNIKTNIRRKKESSLYDDYELSPEKKEMESPWQENILLKEQINKLTSTIELLTRINLYQNPKLQQIIEQSQTNTVIDLRGQQLTDQDMEIVIKLAIIKKECKALWLAENKITSASMSILVDALNNNNSLEELYLQYNNLRDDGVHLLAKSLSNNNTLKILGLGCNGITDIGAKHLSQMIKKNKKLTELWLWQNQISDEGIHILANAIENHNTTLQVLDLRENTLLTDLSIISLLQMIKNNTSLIKLTLFNCSLSETSKEKLKKTQQEKTDFKVYINSCFD